MTALVRLEMCNLTMFMPCFIAVTLVFCSNIRRFYFDNTDTPLIRSSLPLYGYLLAFRLKYS